MSLTFDDFVGNDAAVKKIKLLIHGTEQDETVKLPDMAFLGSPGTGKNMMAEIVSEHLNKKLIYINATVVKDPFQFRGTIFHPENSHRGVIVMIDECHRLRGKIQDALLSALEEPRKLVTSHREQILKDTIPANMSFIFATTHAGHLREALMSRLEPIEFLNYSEEERCQITLKYLVRKHKMNKEELDVDSIYEIAKRSRHGRMVVKNCDNVVRLMKKDGHGQMSTDVVNQAFEIIGIDEFGLQTIDRKLLDYLAEVNTTVGVKTLEAVLLKGQKEISETIEPWLLRNKYIIRRSSGRMITKKGLHAVMESRKNARLRADNKQVSK